MENKLKIIGDTGKMKGRYKLYIALCECGNEIEVTKGQLRGGKGRKSCGCLEVERRKKLSERNRTHGQGKHPLYARWYQIQRRCNDPEHPKYRYYGGRGIKICWDWLLYPEKFYEWFYSQSDDESLTVDRIDNNKDYSPDNCRLITIQEQQKNRRKRSVYKHKTRR